MTFTYAYSQKSKYKFLDGIEFYMEFLVWCDAMAFETQVCLAVDSDDSAIIFPFEILFGSLSSSVEQDHIPGPCTDL